MRMRAILPLLLLAMLAACGGIEAVRPGRVEIGGGLSVQSAPAWNRLPAETLGADQVWSQDGPALDRLLFLAGRAEGEPLLQRSRARRSLQFQAAMTPTEIAELWASELALAGYRAVEVGRLQPAAFAGRNGFRFQYAYADANGLIFDGFAIGTVVAGRLYFIAFAGTRAHHFRAYWPAAMQVIGSAQIATG